MWSTRFITHSSWHMHTGLRDMCPFSCEIHTHTHTSVTHIFETRTVYILLRCTHTSVTHMQHISMTDTHKLQFETCTLVCHCVKHTHTYTCTQSVRHSHAHTTQYSLWDTNRHTLHNTVCETHTCTHYTKQFVRHTHIIQHSLWDARIHYTTQWDTCICYTTVCKTHTTQHSLWDTHCGSNLFTWHLEKLLLTKYYWQHQREQNMQIEKLPLTECDWQRQREKREHADRADTDRIWLKKAGREDRTCR